MSEDLYADEAGVFVGPSAIEESADESSLSLFEGDEGGLRLAQRQCLVTLLKKHVLTAERNPREWATLLDDPGVIKARLNDLFQDLVLDRDRGVAYEIQVRSETPGRFPPLLKDVSYSREETILLVFLRQRYLTDRSSGQDRVHVDRQECLDHVARFRPAHATDVTGDRGKAKNAVDSLQAAGILAKTADEDRFAVSPVIEALLPLKKLHLLLEWFTQENSPGGPPHDDHEADHDQNEDADDD
ncbi:DUF4194 domain-containing protein [Sinomonas sp. P47F7]|uniref:DUF4194 domain-containing protein n=1 Tax=Sinomonas sp. P47F7 TaxID=3410987 RepID=UPI003BF512AA